MAYWQRKFGCFWTEDIQKLVADCSDCLPAENHKLIHEQFQRIKGTSDKMPVKGSI